MAVVKQNEIKNILDNITNASTKTQDKIKQDQSVAMLVQKSEKRKGETLPSSSTIPLS